MGESVGDGDQRICYLPTMTAETHLYESFLSTVSKKSQLAPLAHLSYMLA